MIISLKNGLEKGITLRHIYIYVVLLFSGIIIIPENNNTTCFTMKIDLKKYETAFPQWSASKFSFSAVGFFTPAFYTIFSKTASCHWLSINKLEWKIKPSFELGT